MRPAAYRRLFLTREGEPRVAAKFLLTKPFCPANPELAEALIGELGRIAGLLERRKLGSVPRAHGGADDAGRGACPRL